MPEGRLNMFESRSIRSSIKKIKITKKFLILLLILIMCLCAKKKKKKKKSTTLSYCYCLFFRQYSIPSR